MANNWTAQQKQAIDLRDCSILVSAAAGSGKTAVLVERILTKVTDEQNPINIDSMVIVTFTKAAAGEMKERIRMALEEVAAKNPENAHLQKQKTLIHNANITTIDSFCSMIIHNHFEEIDLDPAFSVADSGQTTLIQNEAMEELLEEYYRKEAEGELQGEFTNFIECYSNDKSDKTIEEIVLNTYKFSMTYPFPENFLDMCEDMYNCESVSQFEELEWIKILKESIKNYADHAYNTAKEAYNICLEENGPYMYEDQIIEYVNVSKALCECEDYASAFNILTEFKPKSLSKTKDASVSKELREAAKKYRDECKKAIDKLKQKYYYISPEKICFDLHEMKENIRILICLVKDFIKIYGSKKQEKNLLDFNDLEHFALKILVDENGEPTTVAKSYSEHFEEIMIDEYQDSNYVQELLLSSISKRNTGKENVFMVGDAKQSIYRFRMARPEIFTDKYDTYSTDSGNKRRVDLFKNFRSRQEVLYSINYIFEHIMKKSLGGIEYNNEAALHPGAVFTEPANQDDYDTEILLYEKSPLKDEEMSAAEFEARMIASKIKKLVVSPNPFMVTDKKSGKLRPCRFNDIAILVRSNSTLAKECVKVFEKMNIPLHVPSKTGYFTTEEIDTVLNLLRIIDNPLQDIPLVTILKSPIVNLSENELALISINSEEKGFYQKAMEYTQGRQDDLSEKLRKFFEQLKLFRKQANIMPLHEVIWFILDETGYGDYICATANGQQKKANMDAFVQKALDFEKTGYMGIFKFVQYIELIRKYNVDEGEVSLINEQDNTVRIMTIHKSKGLEFPVVFVAGTGSMFNRQDETAAVVMHPELGVGLNYVDVKNRIKRTTILKQVISDCKHMEMIGEELRVLYVALTRAKEKLFITGGVNDIEDSLRKAAFSNLNEEIDVMTLAGSSCFMDWILAALNNHQAMKSLYKDLGMEKDNYFKASDWDCRMSISLYAVSDLIEDRLIEEITNNQTEHEFHENIKNHVIPENLQNILNYEYPHIYSRTIPVKVSVSQLKKSDYEENLYWDNENQVPGVFLEELSQEEVEKENPVAELPGIAGAAENLPSTSEDVMYPKFMKQTKKTVTGSDKGNLYHDIMERIDFKKTASKKEIEQQIDELFNKGILDLEMKPYVNIYGINKFINSSVGRRMKNAESNGLLWREQPFVLGVNSKILFQEEKDEIEEKDVLVQGIIDAFFEEDGELVLVDYKTDYVKEGMEDILVRRYKKQMDYYEMALKRLFEKNVKERIIYSVGLNKEIVL